MKEKIFRIVRKAALPAMLAAALTIPVGAFAEGHGGGGHGGGGHAFAGGEHARGGYYGGGHAVVRGGSGYGRGYYGGGWGGGVYFGGAPYYGYGYGYAAPAPACGYYDQYGNWIATACAVPPYGY